MTDLAQQPVRPLLSRFAIERTGSSKLPGQYSPEFDAWIVEASGGPVPIIEATGIYEFIPITKVRGERDYPEVLLETVTKTSAQLERDDASPRIFFDLLELSTKTETTPERDD